MKTKTKSRWIKTRKCRACGGRPDGCKYEPDAEQAELGYPAEFRLCGTCQSPLLRLRETPLPKCRDCDDPIEADWEVDERGLCESCEGNYEWCEVCQAYQDTSWGSGCQHVFWVPGDYSGSGTCSSGWTYNREAFWGLLDDLAAIPADEITWWDGEHPDLIAAIETEIAANAFWCKSHTCWLQLFRCPPGTDGNGRSFAWVSDGPLEDAWEARCETDEDREVNIGLEWLISLEDAKTPAANARTVEWIQLWRANRDRRLTVLNAGPRSLLWFQLRRANLMLGSAVNPTKGKRGTMP